MRYLRVTPQVLPGAREPLCRRRMSSRNRQGTSRGIIPHFLSEVFKNTSSEKYADFCCWALPLPSAVIVPLPVMLPACLWPVMFMFPTSSLFANLKQKQKLNLRLRSTLNYSFAHDVRTHFYAVGHFGPTKLFIYLSIFYVKPASSYILMFMHVLSAVAYVLVILTLI